MIYTNIFYIIRSKFSSKKELNSIIVLIIDKSLEVDIYSIVLFFSLVINLYIKSDE